MKIETAATVVGVCACATCLAIFATPAAISLISGSAVAIVFIWAVFK